jgi:hypothetical protein
MRARRRPLEPRPGRLGLTLVVVLRSSPAHLRRDRRAHVCAWCGDPIVCCEPFCFERLIDATGTHSDCTHTECHIARGRLDRSGHPPFITGAYERGSTLLREV